MLTAEGRENPILRLAVDPARNMALWNSMPELSWHCPVQGLKPGATVLAYVLPLAPPAFMRRRPGARSISSWKTTTSAGVSLKNLTASPIA